MFIARNADLIRVRDILRTTGLMTKAGPQPQFWLSYLIPVPYTYSTFVAFNSIQSAWQLARYLEVTSVLCFICGEDRRYGASYLCSYGPFSFQLLLKLLNAGLNGHRVGMGLVQQEYNLYSNTVSMTRRSDVLELFHTLARHPKRLFAIPGQYLCGRSVSFRQSSVSSDLAFFWIYLR